MEFPFDGIGGIRRGRMIAEFEACAPPLVGVCRQGRVAAHGRHVLTRYARRVILPRLKAVVLAFKKKE
jgi:hypothetical protein